jgi:hypothetical protein
MSGDQLPSWRDGAAKQSIMEFVAAATSPGSDDYVEEPDRIAVFDNDGTLWTEQPLYAQLAFAMDRAAELGHPSIHRHVGQRPIVAAGNTDGDLAMLQWAAVSPHRSLQLVVRHTYGEREYAYDRDPILGSGTGQLLAAAADHDWTVIDVAADWSAVHPPVA